MKSSSKDHQSLEYEPLYHGAGLVVEIYYRGSCADQSVGPGFPYLSQLFENFIYGFYRVSRLIPNHVKDRIFFLLFGVLLRKFIIALSIGDFFLFLYFFDEVELCHNSASPILSLVQEQRFPSSVIPVSPHLSQAYFTSV